MVQEVYVVQNKVVVFMPPAFMDKSSVNLVRNTRPFGKLHETSSGAVRVFFEVLCRRQRPDVLSQRFAELMFVFENNSGLKSQEPFVFCLAPQSVDCAQCIVILKIVPIDRRRIEVRIFIAPREWNELFRLTTRFGVVAKLRLQFTSGGSISGDRR